MRRGRLWARCVKDDGALSGAGWSFAVGSDVSRRYSNGFTASVARAGVGRARPVCAELLWRWAASLRSHVTDSKGSRSLTHTNIPYAFRFNCTLQLGHPERFTWLDALTERVGQTALSEQQNLCDIEKGMHMRPPKRARRYCSDSLRAQS